MAPAERSSSRRRAAASMSISASTVNSGMDAREAAMRRAIVRCVAVGETGVAVPRPDAGALTVVPAGTSAATMRPPGPDPATPSSGTPRSFASLRATGVARARPGFAAAAGFGALAGASPVRSRAIGAPSAAVCPSSTRISSSTPFSSAS